MKRGFGLLGIKIREIRTNLRCILGKSSLPLNSAAVEILDNNAVKCHPVKC